MRVLLSTYGSRGDVEPMVEVRVCVPLVPIGQTVRPPATGAAPPPAADLPPRAAELVAARFDTVAAAAEEGDAPVATVMPTGGWR